MPETMRALIDEIKAQHGDLNPAAQFYDKANWLCEIHYVSAYSYVKDIRITTNVRLVSIGKDEKKRDIIFMRDSATNSEVWPYTFLQKMCAARANLNFLDLAKERPSE